MIADILYTYFPSAQWSMLDSDRYDTLVWEGPGDKPTEEHLLSLPWPVSPVPEPTPYPEFTALEMLDLFTEGEQLAVVAATMQVPAVKLWYDRLIAATFVTYEDPRTEGGLQALVEAELITPERKAEIVAAMQP